MKGSKKTGRIGKEINVYLPFERLEQIQSLKGKYLTTSQYICWCLDQLFDNPSFKEKLGAMP